jgi:hypothetical protein
MNTQTKEMQTESIEKLIYFSFTLSKAKQKQQKTTQSSPLVVPQQATLKIANQDEN